MLIVEDSQDDALLLLRELERGGYKPDYERVETAEAMKMALGGSKWDVIFSDYRMPRFGALEALAVAHEANSEAPLIVVSGKIGENLAVEAMKAGAYDYVMKDNLARLCATIERGLEEAGERRERRRAEKELKRREAILQAVGFAAERFLTTAASWEQSIEEVLGRLGEATGASRVYIFENHPGEDGEVWGTQRYEWVATGVSTQMDNPLMEAIPYRAAGYGRWVELWDRGEVVHGHTREFPEEERPELEAQDILSIVTVPIFVEGRWWGQIGFDECVEEREWSAAEMDALKAAAGTLGATIQRLRIEEQLRGSEERYRAILDNTTAVVYVKDKEGRYLLINHRYEELFHVSREQAMGKTDYDLFSKETADKLRANDERVLRLGTPLELEEVVPQDDGLHTYISVKFPLRDPDGISYALCGISTDITERKRSEEELARSRHLFERIAEATPEILYVFDLLEGFNVYANHRGEQILGYTLEQIAEFGDRFAEVLLHPDDKARVLNDLARVGDLSEGEILEHDYRMLHADGSYRWLQARNVVFSRTDDGRAWQMLGLAQDITERKRAEEALKQSEQLYRTVIEQAAENICLVDVETRRLVGSNPTFQETLGYTEEELQRMTLYDIVAHDRESIDGNIRRVMERKRYLVGERKYRRKDGSLADVEVSASTVLHDGREALCVVAHDVTERARVQELLEERVATLSRIAANPALDLPLADTLDVLAESVVKASTAIGCAVVLLEEGIGTLRLVGAHGLPEGYTAALRTVYRARVQSPTVEAFRTRQPVLVRDVHRFTLASALYAPMHRIVSQAGWDAVYIVPLLSRGEALGAINFYYPPEQEPSEDEKIFLGAVADQTAVAVENIRLFAEARGKAALEERQRLARELHDSVSQALYGIALGAKTARDDLLARDPKRAVEPLDYVLSLAEAGLSEMRALIFELRPESLEKEGLVAALEKQTAALEARHEIEVETILCDEPEASLEAKEAVYRIAQEALHNTVKHARANNARIKMGCDPERITLEVFDDGVGFDARSDFPGHLGLRSMRERTSRRGGTLRVESTPGRGTRICAQIPV